MVIYMQEPENFFKILISELMSEGDIDTVVEFRDELFVLKASVTPFFEGKPYQDKDWLIDYYVKQQMTMADIATLCDCTPATINQWLVRHNIATRSRGRR